MSKLLPSNYMDWVSDWNIVLYKTHPIPLPYTYSSTYIDTPESGYRLVIHGYRIVCRNSKTMLGLSYMRWY